ncbi:unnamed protein product [Auanema sp. JU1783]|nr:unnamed protein product [Auanema sp. JU1783]
MKSISNLYRRLVWKLKQKFDLSQQTITPIQWSDPCHIQNPSSSFCDVITGDEKEKLRFISKEAELFSQLTRFFPNTITDANWKTLLECSTRKQRLDYLIFLRKRERLREIDKQKQSKEREKKAEDKVESNMENWLFNFNIARIESFERQAEWCRVARSYHLPGPRIAIDCRFIPLLSPRAADLTAIQLQHLVSHNKQRREPWPLYFVNYDDTDEKMKILQKKHLAICTSHNSSGPILTKENYTSLAERNKIVYLSPHAETEIEEIEDDNVYVIGGIVDRVPEKGIHPHASRVTAEQDNVRCLRLPLDQHVKWESGHKFLTLLAVMNILQDTYQNGNDWGLACQRHIPVRNIRPPAEKNQLIRAKHQRILAFNREILRIVDRKMGSRF